MNLSPNTGLDDGVLEKLSADHMKALAYVREHGPVQTFRVARHVGYRYSDLATRHVRALLKTLERRGLVAGERDWNGPIFWTATPKGTPHEER